MPGYYKGKPTKRDINQAEIMAFLEACGCIIRDTADVGDGFVDVVAWNPEAKVLGLLEVKNPRGRQGDRRKEEPPRLSLEQAYYHASLEGAPIFLVTNVAEAARVMGIIGGSTQPAD